MCAAGSLRIPASGLALVWALSLSAQSTLEPGGSCQVAGRVISYTTLREADVLWERRVWRTIDLQEKTNLPFLLPQAQVNGCLGLLGVIRHGLLDEGAITAYDPGSLGKDDGFRVPFDTEAVRKILSGLDTLAPNAVSRFTIKEDWIFDKQRSVMEVRIIGLAPMVEVRGEDGELRGHRPLFWLYFPECRTLFARWLAARQEDGDPVSYEGLFASRRFSSTIIKVSNMQDRMIDEHRTGLDALLESEAIRQQLLHMGFDLWNY